MALLPDPLRTPCPAGACDCQYQLLDQPGADARIRLLTLQQEKALIQRIERIDSYPDLCHVIELIHQQLGAQLSIYPGDHEVRTARGLHITFAPQPGLCKKTRSAIPAAIRRCLAAKPHIAYALLDEHSLWGGQKRL